MSEYDIMASDAYSYHRYGRRNWQRAIRALHEEGFTDSELEIILRSKWTRWAADIGGKPYGRATAKDLLTFIRGLSFQSFTSLEGLGRRAYRRTARKP